MGELDLAWSLLKVGVTLGLLVLTLRLVAKYANGGGRPSRAGGHRVRPLEIVGRSSVGRAASVVLMRMGEQVYALGVTQTNVNLLTEVELPDEPTDLTDSTLDAPPAGTPVETTGPTWTGLIDALRERTVRR